MTDQQLHQVSAARRRGCTLRQAASQVGVHVATLCRWMKADNAFRSQMEKPQPAKDYPTARPLVRWRKDCPKCRARVVVRTGSGRQFWRCGRWPLCEWASWRPRYLRDCPKCGAARYWRHSRKGIVCTACGLRTKPH